MKWAGRLACMVEGKFVYRILVGKPEVKRPFRRPRRSCECNIKMDLRAIEIDRPNWIRLAQDRV